MFHSTVSVLVNVTTKYHCIPLISHTSNSVINTEKQHCQFGLHLSDEGQCGRNITVQSSVQEAESLKEDSLCQCLIAAHFNLDNAHRKAAAARKSNPRSSGHNDLVKLTQIKSLRDLRVPKLSISQIL